MKVIYISILISVLLCINTAQAKIQGLEKMGSGKVMYLGFIKVYDADFFSEPTAQRSTVLDSTISKCLVLRYDVSLSAKDLISAAETVLSKQNSQDILDSERIHIDNLHSGYTNLKSGDSYSLCYDSSSVTTTLDFNGSRVVSIKSDQFARLYFGIWLGSEHVLDKALRDNLLSGLAQPSNSN